MSERRVRVLAWGSWLFVVASAAVSIVFAVLSWNSPVPPSAFGPRGFAAMMGLALGTTGAIVASRRPR
ncbi:MAG: hypothetical protein ACXWX0_12305, partial [Actinomycetota bacterium]